MPVKQFQVFIQTCIFIIFISMSAGIFAAGRTFATFQYARNGSPEDTLTIHLKDERRSFLGGAVVSYNSSQRSAHLNGISVEPAYQRKGYGQKLWNIMIKKLKELGIKKLTFTVDPMGANPSNHDWQSRVNYLVNWYKRQGARVTHIEGRMPFMECRL